MSLWYDFDLTSAYTLGLVDLREIDYVAARIAKDPHAFRGHVFGLARVEFSFPPATRFPSLPVRTAERGLYFPLNGVTCCTAPEIEVALGLDAEIKVLFGLIIPWVDDGQGQAVFESFVRLVRAKRKTHPKGLEERLWKEIGNSLYGKLAQGLREKSVFDTRTGRGREVPPSPITNPYFAAHATGFIRAVLGEIISRVPPHRRVVSVTTDGFLTDAPREELDLSGPMCRRFMALHDRVHGGARDA